jgi:hypothetical protein
VDCSERDRLEKAVAQATLEWTVLDRRRCRMSLSQVACKRLTTLPDEEQARAKA